MTGSVVRGNIRETANQLQRVRSFIVDVRFMLFPLSLFVMSALSCFDIHPRGAERTPPREGEAGPQGFLVSCDLRWSLGLFVLVR